YPVGSARRARARHGPGRRPRRDHHPFGHPAWPGARSRLGLRPAGHGAAPTARTRQLGDTDPREGRIERFSCRVSEPENRVALFLEALQKNKIPGGRPGIWLCLHGAGGQLGRLVSAPSSRNSLRRSSWRVASRERAPTIASSVLRKSGLLVVMVLGSN